MDSICNVLSKNNILEEATEVFCAYLEGGNHWSFFVGKTDVSPNVLQQPRKAKTKVTIFSTLTEGEAEDLDKGFGMALAKHVPKEKVLTGIPEEDIPATL
ncbi:hypothetical protein ROHU_002660 [Labeo rohita]|uniref:Uncharacterized protein n=1 Tax=Labeo rohita TaxID=84645 RepID=A0A498NYN1_LABRO|nr:hypothetical protein ROHU_002660 [Labeo rohita]